MIYDWGENCSTNAFSSPVHLQVSCLFERKKDWFLPNTPGERGIETRKRRERHVSKHVFFPETKRLSSPAPLFMDDRKRRKNFTSSAKHRYNHHNSVELFPNNHCNRMELNLSQKTILGFISLLKTRAPDRKAKVHRFNSRKTLQNIKKIISLLIGQSQCMNRLMRLNGNSVLDSSRSNAFEDIQKHTGRFSIECLETENNQKFSDQ